MSIDTDFSVATNGDIRYTGTGTNYTVIALHRWLGDLMDNAQASGDDLLDITSATASARSTDNIITLNSPYNIDDTAAQHLYDGSIVQKNGDEIYDGILVFANAGMYLQIIQNGKVLRPNFWTTGLNADSTNGISHRFMVKVRTSAADIDNRRLIGQTREMGETFSEFNINSTSRGNNVLALTYATDLNNSTAAATIKTWTAITDTEGYASIDVDGNGTPEHYYSDWDKSTFSINQFYERTKWLSRRSTTEDSGSDTGTSFATGDGTLLGQAQSFQNGVVAQYLTNVHFHLKKTGSPTGTAVAKLYAHSGTYGTSSIPTGAALATSDTIDVSTLTTSYLEYELSFSTPALMTASTNYVVSIEYTAGNASNYIQVEGAASGTATGNRSSDTASVWTASATSDLWFKANACPKLFGLPGELFRGITHEVALTSPTGTFSAVEKVTWTGGTGQMLAIDSTTAGTKMWIQLLTGAAPTNTQVITGSTSGATATASGTATSRTLSQPFIGASTGSAIIGAYGVGILASELTANDKLFDLTNTQRTPPNNVTFTVLGLVAGEDRILVGPATGSALQVNQFTLNTSLVGATETAVVVTTSIPSDTPATGTIRVQLDSGIYRRLAYTSYTGSTFTIASTDFTADHATNPRNVYISYIDKLATSTSESFTSVYSSDRSLFIRDRDGGTAGDLIPIKTFETTGTLGSAGGSATVIRTSDQ